MILATINEQTTAYLTVSFKDKDGALVAPTSISYRIDCLTTDQEVLADTPFTPVASQVEIVLTSAQNSIINDDNVYETKRVTVVATYGAGDELHESHDYNVKNLSRT